MDPAAATHVNALLEHVGWIRALALQLVRDAASADDLVQETLLAALRRPPSSGAALRPWLASVTRNQAALRTRGERRRETRELDAARDEALPSAIELAGRAEQHKQLVEAVLYLREPYRTVVLLRYYDGRTPEAIAAKQGVPSSTVRNQLARALAHLRERLDAQHGGDRRTWALALVPLAAESQSSASSAGVVAALVHAFVAMQLLTKLVLVAGLIAVVSSITFFGCEQRDTRHELLAIAPEPAPDTAEFAADRTAVNTNTPVELELPRAVVDTPKANELPPPKSMRLRGEVVAARNGVQLDEFTLLVDDGAREPESITTGTKGWFASQRDYVAGPLKFTMLDREGTETLQFTRGRFTKAWGAATLDIEWDGTEPLRLEAHVGATLQIPDLDPAESSGWLIELNTRDSCNSDGLVPRAWLRQGSVPWARFNTANFAWSVPFGDLVAVRGDGLRAGTLFIRDDGLVRNLKVKPSARLEIVLERKGGAPLDQAEVGVRAMDEECVTWADTHWNGTQVVENPHASRFVFGGLSPGRYEITARARGSKPVSVVERVQGGKVSQRTLVLDDSRATAFVRGTLRSRSGTFDHPVLLTLTSLDDRSMPPATHTCWFKQVDGLFESSFDIRSLEQGAYAVTLRSNAKGHPRWTGPKIVEAPASHLEFVCLDDERLIDVRLRVVDDSSNGSVPLARWQYTIDGVDFEASGPEILIEGVSRESWFEWCVTSQGFGVACGGWEELWAGGRESFGEARLRRGWGAKIRAVDEYTRIPLSDVKVFLDDELAGVTNERGILLVDRTRPPRQIVGERDDCIQVEESRKLGVVVDSDARAVFVLPLACER